MRRRIRTVSASLSNLLLLATAVQASGPPDPDEPDTDVVPVGEVSVTATRAERAVLDVAGNVTVIDREEIDQSPAVTLPDLLRREAGLYITETTTNPSGVQVEARGFNNGGGLGSSLLVQVNGRRVNLPDTSNTDWATLELDAIESIEIVRGPVSALYGDNAVGGVIDIRTRPTEGPARGTLRGRAGSFSSGQGSLKAAATVGPVTGGLFVEGLTTDAYRRGANFDRTDVQASLQTQIGERVLLGASGGRYWDQRGFPGALTVDPLIGLDEIASLGRRAQDPDSIGTGSEVESRFVDAWLDAVLADDVLLRVKPYYNWRDDFSSNVIAEGALLNTDERDKSSIGVNAMLQVDRAIFGLRNRFVAGFDFLRDDTNRNDTFSGSFSSAQHSENEKNVYAGFLQDELNITDDVLLSAGFRFDRAVYDLAIADRLDPGVSETSKPAFSIWSPKAALTWRFLPEGSTYFSYSRGFRLPNFDENAPTLPPAIPDLEPQISDAFEVGAKWRGKRIDASLALYWMNVKNEILYNPLLGCFDFGGGPICFGQNDNVERVRHRGVELALSAQLLGDWLMGYANYTFDDTRVTKAEEPAIEGARMPMTPLHRGNVGLVARLPYDFEVTAAALIVDERILTNDFDRQTEKLEPYATLDLLLAWRPHFGEHVSGALTLALRNLTGEEYDGLAVRSVTSPTRLGFYPAAKFTWEVGLMLSLTR